MGDIILLAMIFCHVIADYNLQGVLTNMKQKSWWEKNYPDEKYSSDYIVALLCHAFSWSFVVHIPILLMMFHTESLDYKYTATFFLTIVMNTWLHEIVDTLKANSKILNLWQDQLLHLSQIVITWLIYGFVVKLF